MNRLPPPPALALVLLLVACSSAAGPPTPPPPTGASASPSGTSSVVVSIQDAVAAVGRFDSNFLGYAPRDADLIGQSAWFEAAAVPGGFEVTFFRGQGDCPAGCIEQSYAKFLVSTNGTVQKRCEWHTGPSPSGTPC